jgi:hypothetical protein
VLRFNAVRVIAQYRLQQRGLLARQNHPVGLAVSNEHHIGVLPAPVFRFFDLGHHIGGEQNGLPSVNNWQLVELLQERASPVCPDANSLIWAALSQGAVLRNVKAPPALTKQASQ